MFDVNAVKSRLGSLSPSKLEQIKDLSIAAWRILAIDLPGILDEVRAQENSYVESVSVGGGGKRVIRRMRAGHGESRVLDSSDQM